jgi:hypothetical protein
MDDARFSRADCVRARRSERRGEEKRGEERRAEESRGEQRNQLEKVTVSQSKPGAV